MQFSIGDANRALEITLKYRLIDPTGDDKVICRVLRNACQLLSSFRQTPFVLRCIAPLRDLTLPTRLIWGARDPFFPLATAERLRRAIPGAREPVHVVWGAGHFPQEDRPDEVARLIAEFLR